MRAVQSCKRAAEGFALTKASDPYSFDFNANPVPWTVAVTPVASETWLIAVEMWLTVVPLPKLKTWKPSLPPICSTRSDASVAATRVSQLTFGRLVIDIDLDADRAGSAKIGLINLKVADVVAQVAAASDRRDRTASRIGAQSLRRWCWRMNAP